MTTRKEQDSIGFIDVPCDRYWGPQTQRSLENFNISNHRVPASIVIAFGMQKKAAILANYKIGKLEGDDKLDAMLSACNAIISGKLNNEFPLKVWQTGSGTQTNMNANEVIAGFANKQLTGQINSKSPVHPNDHCNMHQSSNDTFPCVMHIATHDSCMKAIQAIKTMIISFNKLSDKYRNVIKTGRTHLMDATPVTFGQVFSCFSEQLTRSALFLEEAANKLLELPQGGTAVGNGVNCHKSFPEHFVFYLNQITGKRFYESNSKYALTASHDLFVNIGGAINVAATALLKIGGDLKFLASGPRCGIAEIVLPANEPGSSIMPGKVNPTQIEALTMVATHILGNTSAVNIANSMGHCELNVFKPVIAFNILEAFDLIYDVCINVTNKCINGIEVNKKVVEDYVNNSLMLVTPLAREIGYDNASKVAKYAYDNDVSLREACIALDMIDQERFDKIVVPENMVNCYDE